MDVRTENRGRPHQKLFFPAAPVMGRNFLTPGHPGVRVRNVRGKSGPKSLCLCFFFPETCNNLSNGPSFSDTCCLVTSLCVFRLRIPLHVCILFLLWSSYATGSATTVVLCTWVCDNGYLAHLGLRQLGLPIFNPCTPRAQTKQRHSYIEKANCLAPPCHVLAKACRPSLALVCH